MRRDAGDILLAADPGGSDKCLVDAGALDEGDPLGAVKHLRIGIEVASAADHVAVGPFAQLAQRVHAVRQYGQVHIGREVLGEVLHGGAAVDGDHIVGLQKGDRLLGDAGLFLLEDRILIGQIVFRVDGDRFRRRTVDGHAVDQPQTSLLLQHMEIPADRDLGNTQMLGKLLDRCAGLRHQYFDNQICAVCHLTGHNDNSSRFFDITLS